METDLLDDGVRLMLVGMSTVFLFLAALVLATTLMSRIVMRLKPPADSEPINADEIAAIGAAIARHRETRKAQPGRRGS